MNRGTYLRIDRQPGLWRVELRGPRGHALDGAALRSLAELFAEATAAGRPGILLGAAGNSFCTGLDLRHCHGLDRDSMRELMRAFQRAIASCRCYEGGVVAAVGGHALAGGAILALACDRRALALGAGKMGIHGARMGIAYPDIAIEVVRAALERREFERALYGGQLVEVELAFRRGWAQALVEASQLSATAEQQLAELRRSEAALAANKRSLLARGAIRVEAIDSDGEERFLDRWFAPDTRQRLARALDGLDRTGRDPQVANDEEREL